MDASVDSPTPRTAAASAVGASLSPRTPRSPRCAAVAVAAPSAASLSALNQNRIILHAFKINFNTASVISSRGPNVTVVRTLNRAINGSSFNTFILYILM